MNDVPVFHRRVKNLAELQDAIGDAAHQTGMSPAELPFAALVRIDLVNGQVLFSILKRNS